MCGITGGINARLREQGANIMLDSMKHRGPDDRGIFAEQSVMLGSVRLAIQDLSSHGHQPMISDDGNYILVYNGEIYNHVEIWKTLVSKGFQFHSTSDTETLLNAYIAFGEDCLQMLNGIFAFAVFDKKEKKVFLARDHFGVKPLYYYYDKKQFLFASELKALLNIEGLDYTLQPEIFLQYITLLWSAGDATPFKNIFKLLPRHAIIVSINDLSNIKMQQYYTPDFNGNYEIKTEKKWAQDFDEQITKAVSEQLISDAPLGFFLSGGIDSSLITAIAAKLKKAPVKAFTIDTGSSMKKEGFEDDLKFAKIIAQLQHLDLQIIKPSRHIEDMFDKMIWHLDEPQADPAALLVQNISQAASSQGIKVLLSGMGADEIFSGYRRHQALQINKILNYAPSFITTAIKNISFLTGNNTARRIQKILNKHQQDARFPYNLYYWLQPERGKNLFQKELQQNTDVHFFENFCNHILDKIPAEKNKLNQMLFCDLHGYLPNHNLNYTDKMSMAESIEVRVPYLSKELADTAFRLPPSLKIKGFTTKYILREVAKKYLPREIIQRSKTGFGAPVRSWVKNEMKQMIEERLLDDAFYKHHIFDRNAIEKLIADNHSGKTDGAFSIYSLLCIESWLRQFNQH